MHRKTIVLITLIIAAIISPISTAEDRDLPGRDIIDDFGGGVSAGLPATGDYNCIGVGDVNKDGNLDIAWGAEENYGTLGTTGLYVGLGDGAGSWTQVNLTLTNSFAGIEIADCDGDGRMELYAGYQENANGIAAFEWTGSAFSTSGITSPLTSRAVSYMKVANFTGDSSLDMAVASQNGVRYFEGDGTSPITWTEYSTGLTSTGLFTAMGVDDFNGDGLLDLMVGNYGNGLYFYTLDSGGTSWTDRSSTLPSVENSGRVMGVATGDVNNDGHTDVVYNRMTSPTGLFLLLGNGGGASGSDFRWTYLNSSWDTSSSGRYYQMHLDDVDNDGDLDLLAAKENSGLHLFLGNGSDEPGVNFGWTEAVDKGLPSNMKFFGSNYLDFDDDGDLDIAGATWGNGIMVFQNNVTQSPYPKAAAGGDQTVFLGQTVYLDGTNSSDPQDCPEGDSDGDVLTYDWNVTSRPPESTIDDSDLDPSDSSSRPSFIPDAAGNYTLTLRVRDSEGHWSETEDSLRLSVIILNTPPVAHAGEDRTVFTGEKVILNGSGSYDNEDTLEQLLFNWTVSPGNPDDVVLSDNSSMMPEFTAPSTIGDFGFDLKVMDSLGVWSEADSVNITVVLPPNILPTADAGEDFSAVTNTTISLDGSGSSDGDGHITTWNWTCRSHPGIQLMDRNSSTPSFSTPYTGVYVFELSLMDDRGGWSGIDSVSVDVLPDNYPPSANAGKNMTVHVNDTVKLNGTLSRDEDGSIVTWEWICIGPESVTLSDANSSGPSFTPRSPGRYIFTLRVKDDDGRWSDPDPVSITAVPEEENITEPIENTPPAVTLISPSLNDVLSGFVNITWTASDEDGDPLIIRIDLTDSEGNHIDAIGTFSGGRDSHPWNTSTVSNGTYNLIITAFDGFDSTTDNSGFFTVRNEIPENNTDPVNETSDDDDDTEPEPENPEEDPNGNDDGLNIYQIIIAAVILLLIVLIIFGIGMRIYERRRDPDDFFEE
ncbi:MAG: PKD domain-containing protein [Thermoplasmatota archaeon]